nr:formimidoylglutamate deiminase [Sphingomonas sp. Y57]
MQAKIVEPAQTLFFDQALMVEGWAAGVRLTLCDGRIAAIERDCLPAAGDERHGCGLPAMSNVHSHAFQREMAGRAERSGSNVDSFWTWREAMYASVDRMTPDDLRAVASLAYMEMLESGFSRVGEFHYLHRDIDGAPFADVAEMSVAITAAAAEAGIGLTLLPVLYSYGGFGGLPPQPAQRRFIQDIDAYLRLLEEAEGAVRALPDAIVGIAPHSLRAVSPDQFRLLGPAMKHRPVHIHIAEQIREVEDCLAWSGRRPVEWLLDNVDVGANWCLVHATHMTEAETAALARSGAVAGLCPITEANLGDGIFPAPAFLAAGGRFGIGSDSNVRIDCAEELRLLEYGQRLLHRRRNMLAGGPGRSTGRALYANAARGGAQALGVGLQLEVGGAADIISLDLGHPGLLDKSGDAILDAYIFAAGADAVDCVWRYGEKVVVGGRHRRRGEIVADYIRALERLIG